MLTVNKYFDDSVVSIGFQSTTLPSTVGVMQVGEYEFSTSQFEVMTVVSGELTVLLPNETEWKNFKPFEQFTIAANQSFKVKVAVETAYLCTYEDK